MRAVICTKRGSIDNLSCGEAPRPEPGPGEVRVAVAASAVNPADLKVVGTSMGRFLHDVKLPIRIGYDLAGTVDAVGPDVDGLEVGARVWGHLAYAGATKEGAFSEFVVIAADQVAVLPDGVDFATAAAAATPGMTALQALRDKTGLDSGRVLIIGASGGVGSLAVGVAKRLGAHVTAVCGPESVELVKTLGADTVLDRKAADPFAGGGPYDVVFDTPSKYSLRKVRHLLTDAGAYVNTLPGPGLLLDKLATLTSKQRSDFVVVQSRREDLELVGGWLADGLQAPIEARFPVRDVAEPLKALQQGGRKGRLVIDVDGGW